MALRHRRGVLQRTVKRPRLTDADRVFWAWLSGVWADWRSALVIVKPETVIAWHRKGFRWFWTWKVRHGKRGCPSVPDDVRQLIRRMSRENPLWGAPRIHGEFLKLGIDVGGSSVGKYMIRHRRPPSQTWRTTGAAFSISRSPLTRRQNGARNNREKHSRGTAPPVSPARPGSHLRQRIRRAGQGDGDPASALGAAIAMAARLRRTCDRNPPPRVPGPCDRVQRSQFGPPQGVIHPLFFMIGPERTWSCRRTARSLAPSKHQPLAASSRCRK